MIKSIYDNIMLVITNHDKKVVIPIDLKTSSGREYNFYEHFIKWGYQCQARLYWRLLRAAMDADEYFKDFKLADYRFIVVNSIDNPLPLVWLFDKTTAVGDIQIGNHILRDPETIGKELHHYLTENPSVPNGINITGLNNITQWLQRTQ